MPPGSTMRKKNKELVWQLFLLALLLKEEGGRDRETNLIFYMSIYSMSVVVGFDL